MSNTSRCQSGCLSKPGEHQHIGWQHTRYNGRDFYGEHADDLAELNYLRDWKRWAESSLNAVLNFDEGTCRPTFHPRRPLRDDQPNGYMESDRDFVENNLALSVALLEAYGAIR